MKLDHPRLRLLLLPVVLLLNRACKHQDTFDPASMPAFVVYTGVGPQQQYTGIRVGQAVEVRLRSQTGTGYSWRISSGPGADSVLVLHDRKTSHLEPDGKSLPGGATWEIFTFRSTKSGQANLEFVYERPWEKDSPPAKRFRLTVDVST